MKINLKQKVDLSTYEQGNYNIANMPIICGEIQRLAETFLQDVINENFECKLQPMADDGKVYLVVDATFTHKKEVWWHISVDKILDEGLDQACINGKDKTFLKKMRDALSKQVEKVDLWMELMDKND